MNLKKRIIESIKWHLAAFVFLVFAVPLLLLFAAVDLVERQSLLWLISLPVCFFIFSYRFKPLHKFCLKKLKERFESLKKGEEKKLLLIKNILKEDITKKLKSKEEKIIFLKSLITEYESSEYRSMIWKFDWAKKFDLEVKSLSAQIEEIPDNESLVDESLDYFSIFWRPHQDRILKRIHRHQRKIFLLEEMLSYI